MSHKTITGPEAFHQIAFISETDPSLDPDNNVAPGKGWLKESDGRIRIRNATDDGWNLVGGE